jgi:hypothetical protein
MSSAPVPSTERQAQLIGVAEAYFHGLRSRDVSAVPWHTDVIFRGPLAPGFPEPLVGRDAVVSWFETLYSALGNADVLQHFLSADGSSVATHAMVTVGEGAVLRVIDRFTVDAQGRITEQENHYDPRPVLPQPLEHLFSYSAAVTVPEVIAPLPEGIRAHVYVKEGQITGPVMKGRVLPVGGDWLLLRTDGVAIVDVRATFETEDGALIYTTYNGTIDFGSDGYEKFLAGVLPPKLQIRTAPRFHTADARYQWLNRLQCVGIGEADTSTMVVRYDVYAVR